MIDYQQFNFGSQLQKIKFVIQKKITSKFENHNRSSDGAARQAPQIISISRWERRGPPLRCEDARSGEAGRWIATCPTTRSSGSATAARATDSAATRFSRATVWRVSYRSSPKKIAVRCVVQKQTQTLQSFVSDTRYISLSAQTQILCTVASN